MDDTPVPRQAYDDAIRRGNIFHQRANTLQERLDKVTARDAVSDAVSGLDRNTTDVDMLREILQGSNLRVTDDRALVDVKMPDGTVLTVEPHEAIELMSTQESHANLFNVSKPREPTRQEKHLAWLKTLSMAQYIAYQKKRGPDYLEPEPEKP